MNGGLTVRLLICAGGTGGGVYPALAVYEALKNKPNVETLWVGGEGGMEEDLVKRAGIPFRSVPAAGVHGVGLRALPGNIAKLTRGVIESRRICATSNPMCSSSPAGFVAAPWRGWAKYSHRIVRALILSRVLRSNSFYFADVVTVTAPDSKKYFSHPERIVHTGYPLRSGLSNWSREKATLTLGWILHFPPCWSLAEAKVRARSTWPS
jgi:UDP-N-acetylglucosamine:LPS N-acetylglucosamine transferase